MRYHPSYGRVLAMITDDAVPRFPNRGLAICHFCQRAIHFAGGFVQLLIRDMKRIAVDEITRRGSRAGVGQPADVVDPYPPEPMMRPEDMR